MITHKTALIYLFSTWVYHSNSWGGFVWSINRIIGTSVSCTSHCFRQSTLLFQGKFENTKFRFLKFIFNLFFEIYKLRFYFIIYISRLRKRSTCQCNNISFRSSLLLPWLLTTQSSLKLLYPRRRAIIPIQISLFHTVFIQWFGRISSSPCFQTLMFNWVLSTLWCFKIRL